MISNAFDFALFFRDRCRTTNIAVLHLYCAAFAHLTCKGKLDEKGKSSEESSSDMKGTLRMDKGDEDFEDTVQPLKEANSPEELA